jgi:amino acid adenylation domain-containing protein
VKYLLHHLIEIAACAKPHATAVVHNACSKTYAELFEHASRLSRLLVDLGVTRGDRVGIHLEKSLELVVAVYAAMQAGGAYVPLDSKSPTQRLGYIAADCGIKVLITGTEKAESWKPMMDAGAPFEHLVVLDAPEPSAIPPNPDGTTAVDASALAAFDPTPAETRTLDRDLAYILYTSGSTGRPKGVMLSHANGLAFASWAAEEFRLDRVDRVSQIAPLVFDLSTFDLFATACVGASVHLVDRQLTVFPLQFRRFLEESEISVMYAVPSVLTMLTERARLEVGDLPALRTILFAGEVLPSKYLSRLMRILPHTSFANLYGPTETNVCTFHRVAEPPAPDDPPVSIGRAIDNDETFVVNDDGAIATPGEVGELYVRGATVMQGYWGDPERTSTSLVPNPLSGEPHDRVYRTGDLVREEPDGTYTFFGRRDAQVKRLGYRIELGEIEAAFLSRPEISECAVTARPDDSAGTLLTAHVVLRSGAAIADVTRACAEYLPRYMLPDFFDVLRALPTTTSGKVDRLALGNRAVNERTTSSAEAEKGTT